MKFQDPTSPFKPEQMAAEMAQFTSVEQLQNVNQNLAKMSTANQPMERLAMTGLIGKTVTVDRDYLVRAITDPAAQVPEGTKVPMPVNRLDDAAVQQIVDYIVSLG